jgi:hypothetical protein
VARHAEEAHEAGVARFGGGAQRAVRPHRLLPLVLLHEVVELEQVELRDAQALEGAADLVPRPGVAALARLRGQEEVAAVALHPGADAELGVPVGGGGVDVVHAGVEQLAERPVRLVLAGAGEGGGAEQQARAPVAGAAEGEGGDHGVTIAP